MSTPTAIPDSVIIDAYQSHLVTNYTIFAALTIVCYESIITFQDEQKFIWRRKWTIATWLFLANRYLLLAGIIAQAMPYSAEMPQPLFDEVCECAVFDLNFDPAFSALRVFALLGRAYVIAISVFVIGLGSVAIDFYQDTQLTYYYVDDPATLCRCHHSSTLASILCIVTADIIVLVTTCFKTYRHVREAASIGMRVGFGATLLQYGVLHLAILCAVGLVDVLITLNPSFQWGNPITTISSVFPNIVISRFLIGLREIDNPGTSDAARFSRFSAPNFRVPTLPSIVGNLGEPLTVGEEIPNNEEVVDVEDGAGSGSGSAVPHMELDNEAMTSAVFIKEGGETSQQDRI
ncbi:hypothetical protein NM688_g6200 [Phlebia brevispora]|uniref:Uncharacterized protein n=1 Tax=Phlebia brevispora TaxID=194682 RepID=A0ACC1SIU3_9APHY|nr:hypothetical protein NM688_g6200 [Phlebia brevispora]